METKYKDLVILKEKNVSLSKTLHFLFLLFYFSFWRNFASKKNIQKSKNPKKCFWASSIYLFIYLFIGLG